VARRTRSTEAMEDRALRPARTASPVPRLRSLGSGVDRLRMRAGGTIEVVVGHGETATETTEDHHLEGMIGGTRGEEGTAMIDGGTTGMTVGGTTSMIVEGTTGTGIGIIIAREVRGMMIALQGEGRGRTPRRGRGMKGMMAGEDGRGRGRWTGSGISMRRIRGGGCS
ncbi:hypothetical protein FRB90_004032, partial [Tulasnella sp. 427]